MDNQVYILRENFPDFDQATFCKKNLFGNNFQTQK